MVSPAAVTAAWRAYDQETWAAKRHDDEDARSRCMRVAIEAAAKVDGVEWPAAPRTSA